MKSPLKYLAFLFLTSLTACDVSKYPIDNAPNVKVDTRFIGKWKDKKDRKTTYIISLQNEYQYQIINKNKKTGNETYLGYLSNVEGSTFLNVYNKDSANAYMLLRILDVNAKADRVTIASVSDSTMKNMSNAAEVRKYVTKNLNNPVFYSDTTYLRKLKR